MQCSAPLDGIGVATVLQYHLQARWFLIAPGCLHDCVIGDLGAVLDEKAAGIGIIHSRRPMQNVVHVGAGLQQDTERPLAARQNRQMHGCASVPEALVHQGGIGLQDFSETILVVQGGGGEYVDFDTTRDLHEMTAVQKAVAGQDAVVHLAADTRVSADWESTLKNNFISTYNIFEASKQTGVKRVVFASSQHATGGFYLDAPWKYVAAGEYDKLTHGEYELVDKTCPIRPDGYYGASKAYGEALGSYYFDYHQMSSIHVRIGWCKADNDPTTSPFALTLWLSHRDGAHFFDCCLKSDVSYGVYFATSDNKWKIFDISRARNELGYQPQDGAGEHWVTEA